MAGLGIMNRRNFVPVVYFLVVTLLIFSVWHKWIINIKKSRKYVELERFKDINEKNQRCQPQKIVFLKVHKAGSTSLHRFFTHYASKRNFSIYLPKIGPWVGGYPGVFNSDFYKISETGSESESETIKTDIIIDHMRYDSNQIQKVLSSPKTHKKIAIVREPYGLFISSYNYFYYQHDLPHIAEMKKKSSKSCFAEPYFSILKQAKSPLSRLVNVLKFNLEENFQDGNLLAKAPWSFRVNNSMGFDFNYYQNIDDLVNHEFDLIMILDRFIESLILLKHEIMPDCYQNVSDQNSIWDEIVPYGLIPINSIQYNKSAP